MNCQLSSVILIFLPLLSFHFIVPAFAADSITTHILVSCGTSGTFQDSNNLTWVGDSSTKYVSEQASQNSTVPYQNPDVPIIPFSSARIFTTNYTYTFPLSPGRYFLRLYFYPFNYSDHIASDSFFTATAGPYTLLSNFSALMTVNALNYEYLIREFSINVTESLLVLTFAPSTKHPNAYAFINGIEIVASPNIFGQQIAYLSDGLETPFSYDPGMAFRTMYRLNVGGRTLAPFEDSGGLYRSWYDDSPYIYAAGFGVTFQNDPNVTIQYPKDIPQYIAPVSVYETARSMGPNPRINLNYNLTWILTVDSGFFYLLRFHFCEIQYPITMVNQRVFRISINNHTAQNQFDVIEWSGGIGIPVYMDYVALTSGTGQMDMWIELHPDLSTRPEYFDAILNGLEVFKMGMYLNDLAGLNPVQETNNPMTQANGKSHESSKQRIVKTIGSVIGVSCGAAVFSVIVYIFILEACKHQKKKGNESEENKISDGTTKWIPLSFDSTSNSHPDMSPETNKAGTSTGTGTSSHNLLKIAPR